MVRSTRVVSNLVGDAFSWATGELRKVTDKAVYSLLSIHPLTISEHSTSWNCVLIDCLLKIYMVLSGGLITSLRGNIQ